MKKPTQVEPSGFFSNQRRVLAMQLTVLIFFCMVGLVYLLFRETEFDGQNQLPSPAQHHPNIDGPTVKHYKEGELTNKIDDHQIKEIKDIIPNDEVGKKDEEKRVDETGRDKKENENEIRKHEEEEEVNKITTPIQDQEKEPKIDSPSPSIQPNSTKSLLRPQDTPNLKDYPMPADHIRKIAREVKKLNRSKTDWNSQLESTLQPSDSSSDESFHAIRKLRQVSTNSSDRLSLCAFFRNEENYLSEWLDYYILQGVEHFVLYNHYSTDDFMRILGPYIDAGLVTVRNQMETASVAQLQSYQGCLEDEQIRKQFKWMIFLDIDEFLYVNPDIFPRKTILDVLTEKYSNHAIVRGERFNFCSAGHKKKPIGGVLENYLVRNPEHDNWKSIVQLQLALDLKCEFLSVHACMLPKTRWRLQYKIETNDFLVDHYMTRSKEEFLFKVSKGNARHKGHFQEFKNTQTESRSAQFWEKYWNDVHINCTIADDAIWRSLKPMLSNNEGEKTLTK